MNKRLNVLQESGIAVEETLSNVYIHHEHQSPFSLLRGAQRWLLLTLILVVLNRYELWKTPDSSWSNKILLLGASKERPWGRWFWGMRLNSG